MEALFSRFAGRRLRVDEAVYRSEAETGHRNRAIAYLMLNTGMIDRAPEEVLDLYFRQCALAVTTEDLALMGATLANGGVNPRTHDRILGPEEVRDVLTLMTTCGMYDYAGEWSFEVGVPAKSGVSGAVLAVLPGQLSVAIWSPPLDEIGNSVRGIEACRRISRDFGLHLFMNAATVESVVRRLGYANEWHSLRIRNPRDRDVLAEEGHRIAVVELQGALYFASAERMIRQLDAATTASRYLIIDVRRLVSMDAAAERFFADYIMRCRERGLDITLSEIGSTRPETASKLTALARANDIRIADTIDSALEVYEDMLLEGLREPYDFTRFSLGSLDLFHGFDRDDLARVEQLIQPVQFETGELVLERGSGGDALYVVARGTVSVWVGAPEDSRVRVAGMGPGQFFGELTALGGGHRSADVIADERVVCYRMTKDQLTELAEMHPATHAKLLGNIAREFGKRLRRANALIASLK
jgi:glutaminase